MGTSGHQSVERIHDKLRDITFATAAGRRR
jgi:hypothetical protein